MTGSVRAVLPPLLFENWNVDFSHQVRAAADALRSGDVDGLRLLHERLLHDEHRG